MERDEWDGLVQQFLHHKNYVAGTRDGYARALRNFADWSDTSGVVAENATATDLLMFRQALKGLGLAENTVNARFKHVRSFYAYLLRTGRMDHNPAADIGVVEVALATRDVLTLEELSRLWNATEGRERIIVGLLALCSLRRDEVRMARVEDLHERGGMMALTVRARKGINDLGYVALPDQLAREIRSYLGGRRTGLLLLNQRTGAGTVSTTYIHKSVKRAARRAGIPFEVTSLSLSYTLRSLAMENRFSYVSVVRTAAHGSVLARTELIRNLDLPPEEHASVRLGRMLAAMSSEDDQMLLRSESLLADRSQHPAAAIMLASATLERVMREVTKAQRITVAKKDPSLYTYATLLKSRDLVSAELVRTVERILIFRNNAAHGWFDEVDRRDADWVVREARNVGEELRAIEGPSDRFPD